jgi:hypothetical protein
MVRRRLGTSFVSASVAGAVALAACTTPRIHEDTPAACSNGVDDDGNGLVDCADPGCFPTEACERTAATCRDGIDNDANGLTDCEQPSCRDGGFCASFVSGCDAATQSGCPRGMACYPDSVDAAKNTCWLPGAGGETSPCGDNPAGNPDCGAGFFCLTGDGCARLCAFDSDCPRSSVCLGDRRHTPKSPFGFCTVPCYPPTVPCLPGVTCVSLQRIGLPFEDEGWVHLCTTAVAGNPAFATPGTAARGADCDDAVSATTPLSRICAPGLVCVPNPGSTAACHEVCLAESGAPGAGTCTSGQCVAVDPFDTRTPRPGEAFLYGVCLP